MIIGFVVFPLLIAGTLGRQALAFGEPLLDGTTTRPDLQSWTPPAANERHRPDSGEWGSTAGIPLRTPSRVRPMAATFLWGIRAQPERLR